MFCSQCGAEVREADVFCWKCGGKLSFPPAPHAPQHDERSAGNGDARVAPMDMRERADDGHMRVGADRSLADDTRGGFDPSHPRIAIGPDGTIYIQHDERTTASAVQASTPCAVRPMVDASAPSIAPLAFSGSWRALHEALLAAGFTFEGVDGGEHEGMRWLALDYDTPDDDRPGVAFHGLGLACAPLSLRFVGVEDAQVRGIDDIPDDLPLSDLQLLLVKSGPHTPLMQIKLAIALVSFLGMSVEDVEEGKQSSTPLTFTLAAALGVSADGIRWFSRETELRNPLLATRTFLVHGFVGTFPRRKATVEVGEHLANCFVTLSDCS